MQSLNPINTIKGQSYYEDPGRLPFGYYDESINAPRLVAVSSYGLDNPDVKFGDLSLQSLIDAGVTLPMTPNMSQFVTRMSASDSISSIPFVVSDNSESSNN